MQTPDSINSHYSLFKKQQQRALKLRLEGAPERAEKLKRLKQWIINNATTICEALELDLGKPHSESEITELSVVVSEISHALVNLADWMADKPVKNPIHFWGTSPSVRHEPKGCSLIISPWNYPFNLAIGPLVSAIAAGCTVMLKPSELSHHTSLLIDKLVSELFEPEEVAVFLGGAEVAQSLLDLAFDHIFFTGSPQIGRLVMRAAAEHLSSVTLELGGKSPVLVDASADLDDAAAKIAWAKTINCGQTCIAPDYVLVHHSVYPSLLQKLAENFSKMIQNGTGDILKSPHYGRIIHTRHWTRLKELYSEALSQGASKYHGGEMDQVSLKFSPTILTGTTDTMRIMQEEIFGPILPILSFHDLNEAIDYVNSKSKPLALYTFSNDSDLLAQIAQCTSSGALSINDCAVHFGHPNLPFGGSGESGIGKAHGHYGFLAFSNEKAVFRQSRLFNPLKRLYPPYTASKKKLINLFLRFT